MAGAIRSTKASVIYVGNLAEQVETTGYDLAAHVAALEVHGVIPDIVLADSSGLPLGEVAPSSKVVQAPLAGRSGAVHDEELLAAALSSLASK
jgi:hypothetical protein